jgi:hypothetical protein
VSASRHYSDGDLRIIPPANARFQALQFWKRAKGYYYRQPRIMSAYVHSFQCSSKEGDRDYIRHGPSGGAILKMRHMSRAPAPAAETPTPACQTRSADGQSAYRGHSCAKPTKSNDILCVEYS